MNTELRENSKTDFKIDLFRLMNNAVLGKKHGKYERK